MLFVFSMSTTHTSTILRMSAYTNQIVLNCLSPTAAFEEMPYKPDKADFLCCCSFVISQIFWHNNVRPRNDLQYAE